MKPLEQINVLYDSVDRDLFLQAMSTLANPVSLVTTGRGEARMGLTVSAMCSLSTEPPALLVCINKKASAHEQLMQTGLFGVNVLRSDQCEIAKLFSQKGIDRFASNAWVQSETGAPLLSTALIGFDCRLVQAVDGFTHTILIGTVTDIKLSTDSPLECLVWHQRRYRTSADI